MPDKMRDVDFVRADLPDLRDRIYEPSLGRLAPAKSPDWLRCPRDRGQGALRVRVRDQGKEGSCVAQSLAALIDILRLRDDGQEPLAQDEEASARMIFTLAINQQLQATGSTEFFTLRPGIKAFFHNGACTTKAWPDSDVGSELTADRSKDARNRSLGAYYRLRPLLNHYHAAINEAGAILVAAMIHSGWLKESVRKKEGRIEAQAATEQGGHAFVVVGYDADGFFVLNSWGPDWGGYGGLRGIAHWNYGDWAETILDAWVLRLGVPTPNAFHLTLGEQGFGTIFGAIESSGARRADVVGHYAHLDDGEHVRIGNYPSSRTSVIETVSYLQEGETTGMPEKGAAPKIATRKRYRDVLLRIAGGTEDTSAAMNHVAITKQFWKDADVYPYTLVWCTDFISEVTSVLVDLLERTSKRVEKAGPAYDRAAELAVRGIGRAFWRDVKHSAREACAKSGDAFDLFERFVALHDETGQYRLHLVVEGAGAELLLALLDTLSREQTRRLAGAVATLSLVAPACRVDDYNRRGAPFISTLKDLNGDGRSVLYRPDPGFEAQLRVGKYGKSILHLIANAFEEPIEPNPQSEDEVHRGARARTSYPPLLLGMGLPDNGTPSAEEQRKSGKAVPLVSEDVTDRKDNLPKRRARGGLDITEITAPGDKPGPYDFQKVIYHPDIRKDIRNRIRALEG